MKKFNVYTSAEVIKRSGVTYRMLDHWRRKGYVEPHSQTGGQGNPVGWTYENIRKITLMRRLGEAGMRPDRAAVLAAALLSDGRATLGSGLILTMTGDDDAR